MITQFSSGVAWDVKAVPIYLLNDADGAARKRVKFPDPPELPSVERTTAGGSTERHPPPEDAPEYKAYLAAYRRYLTLRDAAQAEYERLRGELRSRVALLVAFEGLEVPEGWQPPGAALAALGIEAATDETERFIQYVRYGVVVTEADDEKLAAAMWGDHKLEEDEVTVAMDFS